MLFSTYHQIIECMFRPKIKKSTKPFNISIDYITHLAVFQENHTDYEA